MHLSVVNEVNDKNENGNEGCVDIWERNKELIRKRTDIG